ncbi:MAG TPA: hypothetical protein VFF73_32430 [Planctomycetota bacterium]|nr:hypothetical protein [Planctomycetota bacterium]
MRLCLGCGHVDEHRDCPNVAAPRSSSEKVQRIQRALGEIDRTLFALKMSKAAPTRATLMELLSARTRLDQLQSADLADFGQKRAYNFVETALDERTRAVKAALGEEGDALADLFPFARRAVELSFRSAQARLDASEFDAQALSGLAIHPIQAASNRGVSLSRICGEIDEVLEKSRPLDARVRAWGMKNLPALVTGKDPVEVPADLAGGSRLGAIVGRGPASRRASAATQFRLLGDEFRERLYLLAVNPLLLRRVSAVSQAEEAWRKHMAGDGAARWDVVRRSNVDLLGHFLGQGDLGARFDDMILELARKSRPATPASLRPAAQLKDEEWEGLGCAYFLIYASADESSSEGIVWDPIVRSIVELGGEGKNEELTRKAQLARVRARWTRQGG